LKDTFDTPFRDVPGEHPRASSYRTTDGKIASCGYRRLNSHHVSADPPGTASKSAVGTGESLPNTEAVNPIKHAVLRILASDRPFHPPPPSRARWSAHSQSPSWTSRCKRILSKRSFLLLVRIARLGCWTPWAFQSHLRENAFTLRLRRGFCFPNRNFQIIGYPSIRCECVALFFCPSVWACSVRTVGRGGNILLINWGCYYQTLGKRTLDPFTDQARTVPATNKSLVHPHWTRRTSHRLHRGTTISPSPSSDVNPHGYPNIYTQTSNPRLSTGLTSTSLHRAPGPSKNFVRGKAGNVPFWPGGLEDASSGIPDESEGEFLAEGKGIRTIPPGFSRGLRLPREEDDEAGLDGLDRFQKHLAAGQDVVSIRPTPNRTAWLTSFP